MRDHIRDLQAESLQYDQAIVDGQLAHKTNQSLRTELDTQIQNNQRLKEKTNMLRQSEVTLTSRVSQLEKERNELQTAVQEHQKLPGEFELKLIQLQHQQSRIKDDLLLANNTMKQQERLRLEQEQEFCRYRVDAVAHLNGFKKHLQQMTDQTRAKGYECNILQQEAGNLKIKLESVQAKSDQLVNEVAQCKSTIETLRQESDSASEKEKQVRALFLCAEGTRLRLEAEKEQLSGEMEKVRISLHESKDAEAKFTAQRLDLQQQLGELQDVKRASGEKLQQAKYDLTVTLQQAKADYTAELEDLKSRLTLSENARKESQAKLRQTEAAHKHPIECHEQKANARFADLVSESQQEQEKLKAEYLREMEICQQDADTRIAKMVQETQNRSGAVGPTTSTTLVPNTQQSNEHGGHSLSSQQPHTEKTRKKVDRHTNSVVIVMPSSSRRLNSGNRESPTDRPGFTYSRRERSEDQAGYFEEEFEKWYGPQAPLHGQEKQLSMLDPAVEVVPETQVFECAQGVAAQFEAIESQVSVGGNLSQEDATTDLSTIPSEDLSEMLLDIQPTSKRRRTDLRLLSSPKDMMQTPGQSAHGTISDVLSTRSQGRPKSQANTASRMMPLPACEVQRQRVEAHEGPQHLKYARSERSSRADNNDSLDFMHANNATPKRTHAQRTSVHDVTRANGIDSGHKRKSVSSIDEDAPSKKLYASAQSYAQRPSSISKSYASYASAPTGKAAGGDINSSPSSTIGRRSSNRQSSTAGSQAGVSRLSSTRNTRSKSTSGLNIDPGVCTDAIAANRYAYRFRQELERR